MFGNIIKIEIDFDKLDVDPYFTSLGDCEQRSLVRMGKIEFYSVGRKARGQFGLAVANSDELQTGGVIIQVAGQYFTHSRMRNDKPSSVALELELSGPR